MNQDTPNVNIPIAKLKTKWRQIPLYAKYSDPNTRHHKIEKFVIVSW